MNLESYSRAYLSVIRRFDSRGRTFSDISSQLQSGTVINDGNVLPVDNQYISLLSNILDLGNKCLNSDEFDCIEFINMCFSFNTTVRTSGVDHVSISCTLSSNKISIVKIFTWEIIALCLLLVKSNYSLGVNKSFDSELYSNVLIFLDYDEVRIRMLTADLIVKFLNSHLEINEALLSFLQCRISSGIVRTVASRETLLGEIPSIPFDDTTGWFTLESDLKAIQSCIIYLMDYPIKSNIVEYLNNGNTSDLLLRQCGLHINRHIRQSTLSFIKSFSEAVVRKSYLFNVHDSLISVIVTVLVTGLEDDWSQIRRESLLSTQSFLLIFSHSDEHIWLLESLLYPKLLPHLCLSRFYVAEGVRSSAQTAWQSIVGSRGKELLSKYSSDACSIYIRMSRAENHMVSEAACQAMAELAVKIDRHHALPFVCQLINALQLCLIQDSWPIRDAACTSLGKILHYFSELLSKEEIENFTNQTIFRQLKDSIWSVRENGAIALGEILTCEPLDENLEYPMIKKSNYLSTRDHVKLQMFHYIQNNIMKAAKEREAGLQKISFLSPSTLSALNARAEKLKSLSNDKSEIITDIHFSSALPEKDDTDLKKASGWGCCLDCVIEKPCHLWEESDGCVYVIRELALAYPDMIFSDQSISEKSLIENLFDLLSVNDFKEAPKLHSTIFEQLPDILKCCESKTDIVRLCLKYKDVLNREIQESQDNHEKFAMETKIEAFLKVKDYFVNRIGELEFKKALGIFN